MFRSLDTFASNASVFHEASLCPPLVLGSWGFLWAWHDIRGPQQLLPLEGGRWLPREGGRSQRRAGGHWVSGGPAAWSPANGGLGGSGNPGTREPAGGLGIATAGGGYLPRSAGMRARGQRTRLPRETKHRKQIKTRKNEQNKTRWRGAAYGLVWSSVMVHTAGRNEDMQTST